MNNTLQGISHSKFISPISNSRGVTSVELLFSLALLGIVMALALPSYQEMVEKRQLTQGAEQIFAFVNSAQGIASRANSVVTVSYSRTDLDDWCVGATLGATACDCAETDDSAADFCAIDGGAMRITNNEVGNAKIVNSISGDGAFSLDPVRGIMVDLNDSLDMALQSPSGNYQLRLLVSNTGHSELCSVDSDHKVPGYAVCPAEPLVEEE